MHQPVAGWHHDKTLKAGLRVRLLIFAGSLAACRVKGDPDKTALPPYLRYNLDVQRRYDETDPNILRRTRPAESVLMLTVGAVIKETVQTTLEFVSWYLEQGADQIVLVFDDLHDPAIDILEPHPQVQCIRATDAFLESVGMTRERRFVRRQNKSMHHVYNTLTEGWLLHVDGDELLHLEGRTIADELKATPQEARSVLFKPAEYIRTQDQGPGDQFRLLMSRDQVAGIYGDHARAFQRRRGMTGHCVGKTATRAGLKGAHMRQHYMHYDKSEPIVDLVLGHEEGAYLMHFVDQGYDVWRAKLPWRLGSRGYSPALAQKLRDATDAENAEAALRDMYDLMHVFDQERLQKLMKSDAHFKLDLRLEALVNTHFPRFAPCQSEPTRYVA